MRWVNNENIDTNKCSIIKLGILQQIWLEYSFLDIRTVPNKQHDNRHIVLHTVDDMLNKHTEIIRNSRHRYNQLCFQTRKTSLNFSSGNFQEPSNFKS